LSSFSRGGEPDHELHIVLVASSMPSSVFHRSKLSDVHIGSVNSAFPIVLTTAGSTGFPLQQKKKKFLGVSNICDGSLGKIFPLCSPGASNRSFHAQLVLFYSINACVDFYDLLSSEHTKFLEELQSMN